MIVLGELEDKIMQLEQEIESLRKEVAVLKRALRNKIARYEVEQIKRGKEIKSIVE